MTTEGKNSMRLTEDELDKYNLLTVRATAQSIAVGNLVADQKALSIDFRNRMAIIQDKIRALKHCRQEIKDENNRFIAGLEAKFGVSLKDYIVEADGQLTYNPLPLSDTEND